MQLTRSGEYALRAMVHLASSADGDIIHIWEISKIRDVPEKFLRKIIPQLAHAGFIKTERGRDGGIALNRPAHLITILEIIECIEGPMSLNKCLVSTTECNQISHCGLHNVWKEAQDQLQQVLRSRTLADVVDII
jgi:Rrf2 family iron-sulfur cluster assembly transcriptional regulator